MVNRIEKRETWRRAVLAALLVVSVCGAAILAPRALLAEETAAPPSIIEDPPPPSTDQTPSADPIPADPDPMDQDRGATPPSEAPLEPQHPGRFVSEVIDSTYFLEPAEFFALDLPVHARGGARAVHVLGDVSVLGGKRDVIVRLFRSPDYQDWLKRRGGRPGKPFWTSPRQRVIHLDQDLPVGTGIVLLLDNGYSLRTPKRVRVQIQMQYEGEGLPAIEARVRPASAPQEGDITPRANNDDEFAPPPPPPPSEGSN